MPCKSRSKKRYPTSLDAMLALDRIQRQRNLEDVDKHERTYYPCADHYHLTSWRTETGP